VVLELILSLVTNDSVKARSVVELTTNKYFQRSWSSVYRTIENFYCARDESLNIRDGQRLKVREDIEKYLISKLINEGKNLLQIDTTVSSKKDSKKAIDRTYIRQNANNRPVAGYEYSVVCIGAQPKWSVPISINRVKSDENKYSKGSKQIMKIVKQIPQKALNITVGDAGYSALSFIHPLHNEANTVTITRQRINRSIYKIYIEEQKTRGRKRSYGAKISCSSADNLLIPDTEETVVKATKNGDISISISLFKNYLIKGKKQHIMSDKPLNFIQVKVLYASGNRKYHRDLWLCVSGQQKDKISGKEVYEYYRKRFDIEHFFKFGKSKLLMDKFQTNDPNKDEDYMLFVMLAYNILYHAQSSVKAKKVRAWDKKINSNMLSPSEVYRSMPQISLEEILKKSISRGIPDHRNIRNNHQVKPFAPVIRKSNKHGKLEITIKSSFDGSNQITKTSFNKKLELPNNIREYKPAILDKIATVFDTLCTQIE